MGCRHSALFTRRLAPIAAAALGLAFAAAAAAETVVLSPVKDNSLFGPPFDTMSNGAGPHLFAGETLFAGVRRALLEFDVAGSLPAGAVIESATLTLNLSLGVGLDQPLFLHRVTSEWGEGTSNSGTGNQGSGTGGGAGAPATTGDATWANTFFPGEFWQTAGGDFGDMPSAVTIVSNVIGDYSWQSTPLTVADVQLWLNDPAQNHGWIIFGIELGDFTGKAKRFASRENPDPAVRPRLTITYSTGGGGCQTCGGDMDGSQAIDGGDLQAFVDCLLDSAPGTPCECADVNGDGAADDGDVQMIVEAMLAGTACEP